jgi:hypothetical protein
MEAVKEVLCSFPVSGFESINKGEGVLITGEAGSGRSFLSYDIAAALVLSGKKIILVSDEHVHSDILSKLVSSMNYLSDSENVISEDYNIHVDDGNRHASALNGNAIIFSNYAHFQSAFNDNTLMDVDAIIMDTVPSGLSSTVKNGYMFGQLSILKHLREQKNVFTSFSIQLTRPAQLTSFGGESTKTDITNLANRIFVTKRSENGSTLEESDFEGNELVSAVPLHKLP